MMLDEITKQIPRLRAAVKSARRNQDVVAQHNLVNRLNDLRWTLESELCKYQDAIERITDLSKQVVAPLVNLREGFVIDPPEGYSPIVYLDCGEAHAMYVSADGDAIDIDWPFDANSVYDDDCERLGFAVER